MILSDRQETVLGLVVEQYLVDAQPVGSKALAGSLDCAPSTVRAELAGLEDLGLLDHPHTSAGRVPTEAGYRFVVDRLLRRRDLGPRITVGLERHELDEAMRAATEQLAEATELLAIVTAPPLTTSTVRHVELLQLQPQVLMVVVITSNGGVSKRVLPLDSPLDPGLVDWAASFLNERLVGLGFGSRMIRSKLTEQSLDSRERHFVELLQAAFSDLADASADSLFVDGATRMVEDHRLAGETEVGSVVAMLERRVELLAALRDAIPEPDVLVRIGTENAQPAMRSMAMVAAGYGPARRSVGTVSVLGPVRMDYALAIGAVRSASAELSRVVEDVYDAD
ncbi:MAG: heat-inducible transcriptional repressor HrcA [Actinomycetes bacterium]